MVYFVFRSGPCRAVKATQSRRPLPHAHPELPRRGRVIGSPVSEYYEAI